MSLRTLGALFAGEVLVTSSTSTSQRGALYVLDPSAPTHAPLLHWKGTTHAAPHGLTCVPSATGAAHDAGTSGLVAVIESDKAVLSLYSWQRDQPVARIVLPQKMACMELSPDGHFLAAGSADGRLYVWEVATGALLSSFEAHYRALSVIRWTADAAALVTASVDARICVWSVPDILLRTDLSGPMHPHNAAPSPYATFSDHTLAVTDLHVSSGPFPSSARLWSASRDASVKLWDLRTRRLLSTFVFNEPIKQLAVDPLEHFFFANTEPKEGARTLRVDLYVEDDGAWRVRGGRGAEGASERIEDAPAVVLSEPVTAMALSHASSHVALGTLAGHVHLVDVTTLQTARTLHAGGTLAAGTAAAPTPVTNIRSLLRPVDLMGALQLRGSGGKRSAALRDADAASSAFVTPLPMRPVASQFARTLVPPQDVPIVPLRVSAGAAHAAREVQAYLAGSHAPTASAPGAPTRGSAPVVDASALEAQVHTLQAQLERAKALNDDMWQHLVQSRAGATT